MRQIKSMISSFIYSEKIEINIEFAEKVSDVFLNGTRITKVAHIFSSHNNRTLSIGKTFFFSVCALFFKTIF